MNSELPILTSKLPLNNYWHTQSKHFIVLSSRLPVGRIHLSNTTDTSSEVLIINQTPQKEGKKNRKKSITLPLCKSSVLHVQSQGF